jgi:hypothetical protein
LFAGGDGPQYNNEREFAQFVLKAKSSALATNYDLTLYTLVVTNHPYVLLDPVNYALLVTNITPVTAQYFRAEFTQYTAGRGLDGPRIIELDGFETNLPVIITQPINETVPAGLSAAFSVTATGPSLLSYQWLVNASNIPTATNATLLISPATLAEAGSYSVVVSSAFGATTSSNAVLTVNVPVCDPPPSGLVSWWAGEGNANDSFGTNNGTLVGGAGFAPGVVGQAFSFNGTSQYVDVTNSASLNPINSLTLEAWINPSQLPGSAPIFKKAGEGTAQQDGYALQLDYPRGLGFWVYVSGGVGLVGSALAPIPANQWSHVAGVYDGTNLSLYTNGVLVGTPVRAPGQIVASGNDLQIGHDPSNPIWYFSGLIDEASLYDTALSASQIQAIYNANSAGKCAVPPLITSQPQSQMLLSGSTASFSVSAVGSQPLSYQWLMNSLNIPTATNAALVLTNVQAGQSGNLYSVVITNLLGSTNSSNALLSVVPSGSCWPPPQGLVSWWPAEDSAMDSAGTNNGTLHGGVTFAPGEVGEAFDFDGSSGYVSIPSSSSLNVGAGPGFTIEGWINPANVASNQPLVEWNASNSDSGIGVHMWISLPVPYGGGPGCLFANLKNPGSNFILYSRPGLVSSGHFQHVALTYDKPSGIATLYYDGVVAAQATSPVPNYTPATTAALYFGKRVAGNPGTVSAPGTVFGGLMDEMSIYNRVLSSNEIAGIYEVGSAGKCEMPLIAGQPMSQVGYWGNSVTLSVNAAGTGPLYYQWEENNAPITGQTNASLVLNNLQFTNAGAYTVVISNMYGTVTTAPAYLTVNPAGVSIALYPGVTIEGTVGYTYGIQYSTNLSNTNDWLGLTNLTLTQTNALWYDSQPASQPQRYYRVLPGPISIP